MADSGGGGHGRARRGVLHLASGVRVLERPVPHYQPQWLPGAISTQGPQTSTRGRRRGKRGASGTPGEPSRALQRYGSGTRFSNATIINHKFVFRAPRWSRTWVPSAASASAKRFPSSPRPKRTRRWQWGGAMGTARVRTRTHQCGQQFYLKKTFLNLNPLCHCRYEQLYHKHPPDGLEMHNNCWFFLSRAKPSRNSGSSQRVGLWVPSLH